MNAPDTRPRLPDFASQDPRRVAALNALYSRGATRRDELVWRWQHTPQPAVDHWVRLAAGDRELWLGIAAASDTSELDFSWRDFFGDARLIAWSASHEAILELLQAVFDADWLPVDIGTSARDDDASIDAGFTALRGARRIAVGRCRFAKSELPAAPPPGERPPERIRRLPLAIPIVVDRAVLSVGELRKLSLGAVVRVQRRAFLDIGATLRLRLGGADLIVKVTGTRLTVVNIEAAGSAVTPNPEGLMATDKNDAPDATSRAPDAPIDVADMPVELCFEAGRMLTRYDELCRIQPGFTYELGHTLGEHMIDIRANGALIARGELVSLGGQLGVRITALARAAG